MAIKLSSKQKITKGLYEEFKRQRGKMPPDDYLDYDYACFLERKIAELMCDGKEASDELPASNCIKHAVNSSFYCQREIEGKTECETQCGHCKEYYKPLEQ